MPSPTVEQKKAVEYRGERSAVVSASAGSGKTYVLVEHIVRLITDRENIVPADRIAAVTFTEKAAAELKQRLDRRISELLEQSPDDEFLRDQLIRLSGARISTISSFCLSLIQDNLRLLPLEEGFSIGEETQMKMLSDAALKKMFRRFYRDFSEKEKAYAAVRLGREKSISDAVLQLYEFLINIPSGDEWAEEQLEIFRDSEKYREKYILKGREKAVRALDTAGAEAEAERLISLAPAGHREKLNGYFGALFGQIKAMSAAISCGDDQRLLTAVKNGAGRYPSLKNAADPLYVRLKEIRAAAEAARDRALSYTETLSRAEEDREECGRTFHLLYRLERLYSEEYAALKREKKLADFGDMEHFALEAVRQGGGKGMFDYIIVDEFQDSNDIQYEIFRLLSENEKNLYFVGDVKQCIYSFRNANPEIFASLLKNKDYEKIFLSQNFRSSENVINTVNGIFGKNMPESFDGGSWEPMTAGRGIASCADNISELVVINSAPNDEGREASYVAARIKRMVEEGFTVHEKDAERPCRYGDFAVLTRKGTKSFLFRRAFEAAGIPYTAVGDKAFTDLIEVETAMALLGTALRPDDDAAAAAAMMSPVYGFTAEETAKVRLAEGTEVKEPLKRSLYANLAEMARVGCAPAEKGERFIKNMQLFRKTASNTVTENLLREMYEVTLLPELMSVGSKGEERRENLRLLLHYARSSPRPAEFLLRMRNIKRSRLEMPQAQPTEGGEAVNLMTIHKSKGLQFPVVFLSETNGKPNKSDLSDVFIFDRDGGVGITLCDRTKPVRAGTVSHALMAERLDEREKGEETRLLYVAMTRAEEKLIVTAECAVKPDKDGVTDEDRPPAAYKGNYLDFILTNGKEMFNTVRIYSDRPVGGIETRVTPAPVRRTDLSGVRERINTEYPYQNAVNTPAKFTATALGIEAGNGADEAAVSGAFYMGLPLFMKKDRPLTPKERGDVYHKVMENIDFSAESGRAELDRLLAEKTLNEAEWGAVDESELQAFLDSPTAKRAAGADSVFREFPLFTTVNRTGGIVADKDDLSFVQGVADMFFVEDGKIVLVDYKTNRNTTPEKLTAEYKGQLEIYKKALTEMTGMEVKECILYSFTLKRGIKL